MLNSDDYIKEKVDKQEWINTKCDKYDYLIATFCGGVAGIIDVFFVEAPQLSHLGKSVDKVADNLVKRAAQFFYKNDKRTKGKPKKIPETLEQCISYLEQAFPVNYDARYAKDLVVEEGTLSGMSSLNHHLLSLAHSPDLIGLIFSIIDQFMGYATFIDQGKLIHVMPQKTSGAIPYIQGSNFISMLFCGFVNWIGHLLSDLVGSSSTRRNGKTGRGAGVPIPFYELFLLCDFGNIDGKSIAEVMIKVFEEGYDFRFGITMAIPVVIEELMIKVIWMIRQKFINKKTWKESFPTKAHSDLRIMLIIGNATLCIVDGADAVAHGLIEQNVISFICHLNLIGWARLTMLVFRELSFRLGPIINQVLDEFMQSLMGILTSKEKERIIEFHQRINEYEQYLGILFSEFVKQVEIEYQKLYEEIDATFNKEESSVYGAEHSVKLAEMCGVEEEKIIRSREQLDKLFM